MGTAEPTDLMIDHADALRMLADIQEARGLVAESRISRAEAADLLRAKGNVAALARLGDVTGG